MKNYLINKITEGYKKVCKLHKTPENKDYLSGLKIGAELMYEELTKTSLVNTKQGVKEKK